MFRDRFLIADIHMKSDFPPERRFWFDPPFHPNQSALLHRQADDVWRVDFQLGWDADPEEEKKPENILPRLRAMLGDDARVRHRMGERLHVPVPADAAFSPRPRAVRRRRRASRVAVRRARREQRHPGRRQPRLEADARHRRPGAGAAARHRTTSSGSRRPTRTSAIRRASTDFITPKSAMSRTFRDAVLSLARHHAFARRLVNSGRLSMPARATPHRRSIRRTASDRSRRRDGAGRARRRRAGDAAPDRSGSSTICGGEFTLVAFGDAVPAAAAAALAARPRFRAASSTSDGGNAAADSQIAIADRRRAARASATTDSPARATSSGPISTSARAGAPSTPTPCARAIARATGNA